MVEIEVADRVDGGDYDENDRLQHEWHSKEHAPRVGFPKGGARAMLLMRISKSQCKASTFCLLRGREGIAGGGRIERKELKFSP